MVRAFDNVPGSGYRQFPNFVANMDWANARYWTSTQSYIANTHAFALHESGNTSDVFIGSMNKDNDLRVRAWFSY